MQKNEILLKKIQKEKKGEDAASILYYSDNRQHMIKYNFISIRCELRTEKKNIHRGDSKEWIFSRHNFVHSSSHFFFLWWGFWWAAQKDDLRRTGNWLKILFFAKVFLIRFCFFFFLIDDLLRNSTQHTWSWIIMEKLLVYIYFWKLSLVDGGAP